MILAAPVDVEGAVRAWLRGQSDVAALVSNRVFFGIPAGATFPLLTVQRVGGGADMQAGGGWVDRPLVQIDCWGTGESDKVGAAALATAVQTAVHKLRDGTHMVSGAVALWALIESVLWAPDPESGRARYVVDAEFGIRAG